MATEKKMRCCDCKFNRPVGSGLEGICVLGHGTLKQKEGCFPLSYNPFDRPSCWEGVFGPSPEERLTKIEERLELLEKAEQVKAPKKPELLVEMFQVIADTYAAGEVNEALMMLRDEISKSANHYHDLDEKPIYLKSGEVLL